jgi:prephenate dehydrogenase
MVFQKVGIIGLGLIGGSIAKVLKGKGYYVATVKSKSPDIVKAKKIVDRVFPTLDALAAEVDLLILATPLSAILPIAREIKTDHPLLVIDVGSVKGAIVKEFSKLTKGSLEFLSTHPMAGTEKSGFDASDPHLFKEAPWIIVPHKKNKAKIADWIKLFGAKPIVMSADEHDKKVALISHLPAMISKTLLDFIEKKDPESIKIGGPGFKSMTRLARGNHELMDEIHAFNQINIDHLWEEWISFNNNR